MFNFFYAKAVYKLYQEVTKVLFIITSSKTNLLQKSTIRPSIPAELFIWRSPQVEFLSTIHSLCTVRQQTNQIDRGVTTCYPLPPQMRGLSLVLWGKKVNFGDRWTGTDIVRLWYEAKQANFPGWKPFQCHFRFRLLPRV